jgi:hypothetical protein
MAEVFSDDLNLEIGDLLSHPRYPANSQPCARPFMLIRPIQAHSCMFCARARLYLRLIHERTRCCKRSFLTTSLVYFRNPKLSKEYKHFEPSDTFEPLNGKNIDISKPDSIPLPL